MSVSKRSERNKQAVSQDMEGRKLIRRRERETMTQHNFRMQETDYRILEDHFRDLGLSIGAGIRMALREYMKRERL